MARYFGSAAGTLTLLTLSTAPEGGWSWFEDPRAIASGSYTYAGYNDGGDLKLDVSLAGVHQSTVSVAAGYEYDDHDTPTMYVRSDGKLDVFYSKHVGPQINQRTSTNTLASDPTLSGGFAAQQNLSPTFSASVSTYPSPLLLSNVDGAGEALFLFWREAVGPSQQWWYAEHTAGAGWLTHVALHSLTYSKIEQNGTGRIDLACSLHPVDGAQAIYHLYRESAAWHKSDSTTISASLPYAGSDLTTVYTASGTDRVWVTDIAIDASSHPIVLFARWPSNDTSDVRHMYARWTGSAWSVTEICAAGAYIADTIVPGAGSLETYYHGGANLDHTDPQIVYISRQTGSSAVWEMYRYVTANGGTSFSSSQLTTGSTYKNIRPVSVRGFTDTRAIWPDGTYHDYVNYSLGMKGYKP